MKEATAAEILSGDWDKVVLATGAHHTMPPIPGIAGAKAVQANDVLTRRVGHGRRVVVIGGGLVGCETAAMCAENADTVTVIETLPKILMSVDHCRNNEQALNQLLEDSHIEFITDAKVTTSATRAPPKRRAGRRTRSRRTPTSSPPASPRTTRCTGSS